MAGMDFELSLPMISLPTKETVDATFIGLKPLISGCYGEDPDSFDSEIKQLDRLRQTRVTKDYAGCSLLRKYFAQLHLLDARFPKSMTGGAIPLEFKWKDAFTGKQYLQEGIHMEQTSVLFNLAALHSQLGAKSERLTEQEIKEACTHFQCAAGVFVYLYDNFGANYCKDMAPELIEMFKTLMLAQAQECYVEKSIKFTSGVKYVTVSKLAAKLYEYYQFVLASLESDSCVAVVKANKDWPRLIQIKTQYYLGLSHFFQGGICKEQGKYGEMVVYYIAAVQVVDKIGKLPKGINEGLKKAIQWLTETAKKEAAEAKKQNDYVFHEKLPPMEHLEAVQGAALAKPNVFQPADPAVIGVDIFSRLVPMTAHEQSSVYSEEKAKLLRTVTAKVEEKDAELEQYLGGLNIAELRVAQQYKPIVPVQIKQKVEWFQQHVEDVNTLRLQLEELKTTCNNVDEMLKMITARKEQEDKDEKEFQSKHGARSESQVCKELWNELDACVKYHHKAAHSNKELDSLYSQHSVNINLFTNSMDSVMANLPKISLLESPTVEDSDTERLDVVMEEVDKMKKQRKELISKLRQQISHDDITTSIIGQKENEQEVAMSERLQRHKDLVAIVEQNLTAQERILQVLTDVNAKHAVLRETQQDISGKQEQYFGSMLQSADVFPVLQVKVQEGLRFFSQLKDKVSKLQRRATDICDHQQRKREAQQRNSPGPPTSSAPSTAATSPIASHDLPPARPPKRDDQRGEPLTNQSSTPYQPHPSIPPVKEPVSFQQPMTSPISSHELNDEQQGFLMYQDSFAPQQQGLPQEGPTQQLKQGFPPQQQSIHQQQGLTQQQKQEFLPQQPGLPPQQQGLPLQQQSIQQQQQAQQHQQQQGLTQQQKQEFPPQQPGLPPQQGVPLQQQSIQQQAQQHQQQQQGLTQQQKQEFPPQQPGLPPQQQGLPPQQQSIQELLPPLLGNVEQHRTPPDQQIVLSQQPVLPLAQEVVSEEQAISLQQPQLHQQQNLHSPQPIALSSESPTSQTLAVTNSISCDTVDTPLVVSNSVTVGDHSSANDVMMQSLLYSISKSPSIASENDATSIPSSTMASIPSSITSNMVSIPSSTMASVPGSTTSNMVSIPSSTSSTMVSISNSTTSMMSIPSSTMASIMSNEGGTPHTSSSLEASLYGNTQLGGVAPVQAPQSNPLDQLDPLALLGEKKLLSWSKDENKIVKSTVDATSVSTAAAATTTTAVITEPVVTTSIDALLQKQQEHSMELRKERTLLLEQLELHKRQQEQDKMMSNSHAALLHLVQQQQQSIHQQQIAIQQCHKENALLRQDRDTMEMKYRSMITEEQGKQQTLQQQLANCTSECQQYKQQIETQQKHLQQLSHTVKVLDEQNKQIMQQHASQLSHLEQQHKQHTAAIEEKHKMAFNQLQQEHKAAENGYKQEIDRLTQHITAITRQQQMKPIPTIYQQHPLPKANLGQVQPLPPHSLQPSLPQLPMQQPPQQSYRPHPPPGVLYMQKPTGTQLHPHQPSAQQPHPQAASINTPYYTQASQEHPNSYHKLSPRP